MTDQRISVVVVAKNEEQYISRVIESVVNQEYPKELVDIVLIDNYSTDRTREIAGNFKSVKIIKAKGSIGSLRNQGAEFSRGAAIAFLDGDCIVPRHWLRQSMSTLLEYPSAVAVNAMMGFDPDAAPSWVEQCWVRYHQSRLKTDVTKTESLASFCFVAWRQAGEAVGWFDASLAACEDADLGYRLIERGGHLLVDKSIDVAHLGNARSLRMFFRRQLWQGSSNLNGISRHRFRISEIKSVILPLLYVLVIGILPIFALAGWWKSSVVLLLMLVCIPIGISMQRNGYAKVLEKCQMALIWSTYLTARGVSIFSRSLRNSPR